MRMFTTINMNLRPHNADKSDRPRQTLHMYDKYRLTEQILADKMMKYHKSADKFILDSQALKPFG